MADGRGRGQWAHTSHLLAMMANQNRAKGKRPAKPSDFNPYSGNSGKGGIRFCKDNISQIKELFGVKDGSHTKHD